VLASGPVPPNPSELLQSRHAKQVILDIAAKVDFTIIDTPPLLPVTDAAALAALADATLLVLRAGKTTRDQAARAVAVLEKVGKKPVGVVLNMVSPHAASYDDYSDYLADRPSVETKSAASAASEGEPGEVASGRPAAGDRSAGTPVLTPEAAVAALARPGLVLPTVPTAGAPLGGGSVAAGQPIPIPIPVPVPVPFPAPERVPALVAEPVSRWDVLAPASTERTIQRPAATPPPSRRRLGRRGRKEVAAGAAAQVPSSPHIPSPPTAATAPAPPTTPMIPPSVWTPPTHSGYPGSTPVRPFATQSPSTWFGESHGEDVSHPAPLAPGQGAWFNVRPEVSPAPDPAGESDDVETREVETHGAAPLPVPPAPRVLRRDDRKK
jgi:hypothetical protein